MIVNKHVAKDRLGVANGIVDAAAALARTVAPRVERFDARATESFESLQIRIRSKFYQNSRSFVRIHEKIWKCEEFSTFSRSFGEIPKKIDQNLCTFRWKLLKNNDSNKNKKTFDEFLRKFWIWSGAKLRQSCRNIWFSLFFSPGAPRRLQTTNGPENPVSSLENRPFQKCMSSYLLF